MAVAIRLQRYGRTKRPYYRLVATDSENKRDGKFLEILGTFNPIDDREPVKIQEEPTLKWLKTGAQPTATARDLLKKCGLWEKFLPSPAKK